MNRFQVVATDPEQILNLTMDRQQALGVGHRFESANLAFLLTSVLMRDLSSVVFVLPSSMLNRWKDLLVSGGIALEFICDQLPRRLALSLQHFAKEPLSSSLVSAFRNEDVEDITVLINCSPKVVLLTLDLHEDLIDMPDVAQSAPFPSDCACVTRPELRTPGADSLVGDDDAALGQQVFDVSKAEREAMVEPDPVTDDFCWETMAFVERVHLHIFPHPEQLDRAKATDGYRLPARHIFHTVGPVYRNGRSGEPEMLLSAYLSCLQLAEEYGCETVGFPSISTGAYGYPIREAAKIALETARDWLSESAFPRSVTFVLFSQTDFQVYETTLSQMED